MTTEQFLNEMISLNSLFKRTVKDSIADESLNLHCFRGMRAHNFIDYYISIGKYDIAARITLNQDEIVEARLISIRKASAGAFLDYDISKFENDFPTIDVDVNKETLPRIMSSFAEDFADFALDVYRKLSG